jgi:HSP20 family protein
MAFTTHPLVTRPATWLRPQRNQELTPSPYPDMSRMFEDMLTAITRFPWSAMPPEALAATKTEVSETDKEISIVAELPGVSQQDLEVSLDNDVLTIRAQTRGESTSEPDQRRHYSVTEREYGRIVRAFRLPFSPDPNQVVAELQDGLLSIRIEKPQSVQDKVSKIPVHAGTKAEASAAAPTDDGAKTAPAGQNKSAKPSQAETPAH